jgi:hypothetical protein
MNGSPHTSYSLLLLLFADRFVPPMDEEAPVTGPYESPSNGTKVRLNALAVMLVAAGLLDLRERQIVKLEIEKGKMLFLTTNMVSRVHVLKADKMPGFEGGLLAAATKQPNSDVTAIVSALLGSGRNPPLTLVHLVEYDAFSSNLAEPAATSIKIASGVKLEDAVKQFETKWNAFQSSENELFKLILRDAGEALSQLTR